MAKDKDPKVILVDHGVANNFGTHIEINKELLKDPELYAYVLAHELEHSRGSAGFHDFLHDMNLQNYKMVTRLALFVFKRPKLWVDFFPIQISKDRIVYDKTMLIQYVISFVLLGLLIYLLTLIL